MIILYVNSDCGIHFLFTDLIVMKLVFFVLIDSL